MEDTKMELSAFRIKGLEFKHVGRNGIQSYGQKWNPSGSWVMIKHKKCAVCMFLVNLMDDLDFLLRDK